MTFISGARRLLAPIKQAKFETFLQTIYYASRPLSGMAAVYFLQQLTQNIQNNNQTNLESNLLYFGIFIVVYNTRLFIGRNRTWVRMTEKYAKIIQSEYMLKFLELDNNFTDKKGTGYLISVFEKGIYQWSESIQNISRYTSGFIVSIGFIIYSFSRLPPVVNIGLVSVLLICVGIVIYLSKGVSPIRAIENHHQNNRSKSVVRVIMSKMEIVQNGQFSNSIDGINQISNQIINTKYIRSKYIYFMYNLPEILISVIQFGVFGIMGYGVLQGTYQLSDLVLVSGSIAIISTTLNEFTTFYKDFYKDFGKVEQLRKLIDEGGKIDYEKGETFKHQHGNISFKNVSYSYSPNKPVFHNFNLSIIGGKKTALVGPSGGGKSTLIKLIAGYIRPDEGNIIIDGQSLSETSLKSYYKHIGYLTQEPSVFDGTIRENLMYGISDSSSRAGPEISKTTGRDTQIPGQARNDKVFQAQDDTLAKIISLSRCEWIHDLPHGLDTEIGEKGVRLSGGQRQRLAIAKIMLKNPDIILLDEPTSALDSENEELVTQALDNLFKNKTVIVVAHRLQTVKHADQILFIDRTDRVGTDLQSVLTTGSSVVEQGTHEELLQMKGKYYKMVELQSGF